MRDRRGWVRGDREGELGDDGLGGDRCDMREARCEGREEALHNNVMIVRVADFRVVGMELREAHMVSDDQTVCSNIAHLDSARGGDTICEVAGIEVASKPTDRKDQLSALDLFLDFRVRERPYVDLYVG